jgi:hypothetical protein
LAATVVLAGGILAELRALRRVDAVQPNSCSANIKGVAVDDRGSANDRLSNGWSGEEQDKKAEQGAHAGALHTGRHS